MQYCLDVEHLCYCDAEDNTFKLFPPEGSVVTGGDPCECVEKDGVKYCNLGIVGLCDLAFCVSNNGEVVTCYDTERYFEYAPGLCLEWDFAPLEEYQDCSVVGEACGEQEGYICTQWPNSETKCAKTCESIPSTCSDQHWGCRPFWDWNGKVYPVGVCSYHWI